MNGEPVDTSAATRREDRPHHYDDPSAYEVELDKFGIRDFVNLVAGQLLDPAEKKASGLVVGLTGPWGSGKTFVLNWLCALIRQRLGEDGLLIRFEPWRTSGREDVLLAFLRTMSQELALASDRTKRQLADAFPPKVSKFIRRHFSRGKETAQSALDVYEKGLGKVLQVLTAQTVDQTYAKVSSRLEQAHIQVVVVIDDLDRLDDNEIRDIAMLVKSVGHFENVSYLLAYDPRRVARALTSSGDIDEGLQYLEKIVQLQLRLPRVPSRRLREFARVLLEMRDGVESWCNVPSHDVRRVLDELVPAILWTPRDLVRFSNLARARIVNAKGPYIPDLLRLAALEVRFPLLSDRLSGLVERCTVDGVREIQRCQQSTIFSGEEVIDRLLHGVPQVDGHERHPNSRALLKLLFPALRPEGTEQVARPVERLCYENSLKAALNHQQKEELLTIEQADHALGEPGTYLADVLTSAAESDVSRHANLRLRTQYRSKVPSEPEVVWHIIAEHFDGEPLNGVTNWSMFLDLSHVWVRGAATRFIDPSIITAERLKSWIEHYLHLPACVLFFECAAHQLHDVERRANLRPILQKEDVRELLQLAGARFSEKIMKDAPMIKSLYPLWVVNETVSPEKKERVALQLSDPTTDPATDAIVCLLYRTWHETTGRFTLRELINAKALLPRVREHERSEDQLPLPVQTAYAFVQDNLY